MATFVLVHGAMHGGWCWRDVRLRLQSRGHEVYAPTLTGQGERRQSLSPLVGVSTHVADITELLWFEDLTEVHLVLHSYAGVLAGPVAEREGHRLASVVYLGAFVTAPGQSLLDVEPEQVAARYRKLAEESGEGWFLPATAQFLDQWGITDQIKAKSMTIATGSTASFVANGQADIAIQLIPELKAVPGVQVVPFPEAVQNYLKFQGGINPASKHKKTDAAFLKFLSSPAAVKIIKAKDMEPGN